MQNLSYENEFDLHENEQVGGSHFHMNDFVRRLVLVQPAIRPDGKLVLKQRQKVTRRLPKYKVVLMFHKSRSATLK